MGSGVCAIDYDGDGWQDLLFVNSMDWPGHKTTKSTAALYHNNQDGTFTDVTRGSGLGIEVYGMGCAVGDYDNDGRDDIYLTALDGNHLFHNLGGGRFAEVTAKAGVRDAGFSTGAVWFDYDNDGRLDLFVAHYVDWSPATDQFCSLDNKNKSYCTPEAYKGQSGTLFHNKGNGVFEDVTRKAGLFDPTSKALGVVLLDYDQDGWPDLFVTNDTQANKLYRNNHNGTFTESAFAAGVGLSDAGQARAGMGADAADYDGSGRPSLVIGNFTNESMSLYRNDAGGLFTDRAIAAGIASPSAGALTFSALFFDYDLDGLSDIFALNGHVADDIAAVQPTVHYAEPPLLFHNRRNGTFDNASEKVGAAFRQPLVGRGAAYLDYDNDGDLDLVITPSSGPAKLLRNEGGNANDVLRVKLEGTRSNRDAIGALVTVKLPGGRRLAQWVKSGSSYLSQSELPLTFGLGRPQAARELRLEVAWPSGRKESVEHLLPNQSITVVEGKGMVAAAPILLTGNSKKLSP
ncbi:MAG TPA: CRTAC1 family protein [Acidobacteriaceae bacterium]